MWVLGGEINLAPICRVRVKDCFNLLDWTLKWSLAVFIYNTINQSIYPILKWLNQPVPSSFLSTMFIQLIVTSNYVKAIIFIIYC
jgi:hypothetical protein